MSIMPRRPASQVPRAPVGVSRNPAWAEMLPHTSTGSDGCSPRAAQRRTLPGRRSCSAVIVGPCAVATTTPARPVRFGGRLTCAKIRTPRPPRAGSRSAGRDRGEVGERQEEGRRQPGARRARPSSPAGPRRGRCPALPSPESAPSSSRLRPFDKANPSIARVRGRPASGSDSAPLISPNRRSA